MILVSINQAVYKELSYKRMEVGVQTPEETLRIKSGSCRDFAWLLIHVLRHFGLAARFVSGYIVQLSPTLNP
jgi:transglutaminase-like putative cysteine protease